MRLYPKQLSGDYAFALTGGRYTIIGWDPLEIVTSDHKDPIAYMQARLKDFKSDISPCGGWYGYIGYEFAESLHAHLKPRSRDLPIPDLCMGLYDKVVVFDHEKKLAYTTFRAAPGENPPPAPLLQRGETDLHVVPPPFENTTLHSLPFDNVTGWSPPFAKGGPGGILPNKPFTSNFTPNTYKKAFDLIQTALKNGDCYQVNLAQRFTTDFEGNPWDLFIKLMQTNPGPFSAYFNYSDATIISCSPERFIKIDNGIIETKPIKGTCAREEDPEQLKNSEKNRAENLMIVDLMRNDLGKICETGSVQVTDLFKIESYPSVHHLVSTVTGKLKSDISPLQAFQSCFPGGSITGAPKLAAMQQIRTHEPHARHVYCGSIGYCDFSGVLDMNIAIRTAVVTQGQCHVWAGGGIVLDSSWEDEYQECMHKIQPFLRLPV